MAKLTTANITTLSDESSALTALNNNFDAIEVALEKTLSRDGTIPNEMESDMDLNGYSIINMGAPVGDLSPLRLADLEEYIEQLNGTSTLLPAAAGGDVNKVPRVASAGLIGYSGVGIDTSNNLRPQNNDTGSLGTTALKWADLFLASGGVINFDSGDVLITHSANGLTFSGVTNGYSFDDELLPSTNDSAALGTSALSWSDLFLASGGIINFNNGDVTLTHSADTLTLSGGSLVIASGNVTITGNISLTGNAVVTGNVSATGTIQSSGGAIGYTTGAGGTVTQLTSKSTGVTINELSGQITMNNASLTAATEVTFIVTNSTVTALDVPVVAIASGGTANSYLISVTTVAAGSFSITITNATAGALGEALVINFAIIKGASA